MEMWAVFITVAMALFEHNFLTLAKHTPDLTIDINMDVGSDNKYLSNKSGTIDEEGEFRRAVERNLNSGST